MPLRIQLSPRPKKAVRILALSDWRVQDYRPLVQFLDTTTEIDVIVYSGDDLDRLLVDDILVPQLAARCAAKRLLFVAGNDDPPKDRDRLRAIESAHDLEHEPFFFNGMAFCGLEATTDGMGPLQHTEQSVPHRLARHLEAIRKRFPRRRSLPPIVLVSHAPPRDVLDLSTRFSASGAARSIGSPALRKFLDENCVPLTICGHVHLCGGQYQQLANQNIVLNIASHDDPKAEGRLALIDLEPRQPPKLRLFSTRDLHDEDELLLLHQLGARAKELRSRGIVSLAHVTEQNRERLRLPGTGDWHIDRWIRQAALLKSGRAVLEITEPKKLRFLDGARFVTWDIETDLAQTRIWLIGAYDTYTKEFRQFFNADDESRCVGAFLNWMAERRDAVPISYSNSKLEKRALAAALQRHGLTDETDLVNRDIDLCIQLENRCIHSFRVPSELKEFAPALGFRFRHTDLDGMAVGMAFEAYLKTREVPNGGWGKLLEYNEDDVRATLHVFQRLFLLYRGLGASIGVGRNGEEASP